MRWINKSQEPYKTDGDNVIKDFLNDNCRLPNGRYQNVRYDSRDSGTNDYFTTANGGLYRKRLTNILLDSQGGLCCYCMRKIKTNQREVDSDEVVTREHIIPRGFDRNTSAVDFQYYQNCQELSPANVILTDEFEDPVHNQINDLPPYPHKVSYNNLVASCNGTFPYIRNAKQNKIKICCNEVRQEKKAFPVYYCENIEESVEYLSSGDIHPKSGIDEDLSSRIEDVISNNRLDCDQLRNIRFVWSFLSNLPIQRISSCRTQQSRDNLFCEVLYNDPSLDMNRISNVHSTFVKDEFWEMLMLYDYFHRVHFV